MKRVGGFWSLGLTMVAVPTFALLAFVPLEDRVAEADLIVTGRLTEIERFGVSIQSTDSGPRAIAHVDTAPRYFLDRGHIDVQAVLKVGNRLPTEHNSSWFGEHGTPFVFPSPIMRDSTFTTADGAPVRRLMSSEDFSPSLHQEGIWLLKWAPFVQAYAVQHSPDFVPLDSLDVVVKYIQTCVADNEQILSRRVQRRLQRQDSAPSSEIEELR